MTRKILLLIILTLLAVLAATPASAYVFWADCRGGVRWNNNDVTWRPSLVSFPSGGSWYQSIDASRVAWNSYTPGANYRINYVWDTNTSYSNTDGRNSILTPAVWPTDNGYLAVTYPRRSMCYAWPGPDADWVEMDIIFNGNRLWENSLNPVAPQYEPFNVALVAIHEHGHGLGLTHEDDQPATMNSTYPNAGPIGNPNYIHPHADDARGNRALYGTAATQRDVAAFKYRLKNPQPYGFTGASEPIPPPTPSFVNRNQGISFQFAVENRGTADQSSVPVYFYLTPTRNGVTTSSYFIGSTTLSLNSGASVTPNAFVTIPANAPTGTQYIGWIIDPFNSIVESDETNNGNTHVSSITVGTNRAPTACFTAFPTSGNAPLNVQVDASCASDPDGHALTYSWDFGDGYYPDSGVTSEHWYYSSGFYIITLTVTDSLGASSQTSQSVFVSACDGFRCVEEPM